MKKVLTMTLNPCIDRTVYFETFYVGATNIVKKVIEEVAGKGINVAVGLSHINIPVKAMGFAYKEDLQKLYGKLEEERIEYSFVEVDGRLRVNQKLFDESKAEMTECNEKGNPVRKEDVDLLLKMLREELADASLLVLSGSVPPGVDANIYAVMTSMAKETGVKVILDASGKLLAEGVKAGPYLIKPNREEFVKAFLQGSVPVSMGSENGLEGGVESCMLDKCRELLTEKMTHICLSLGEEGAMLISREEAVADDLGQKLKIVKRPAIPVTIRSLQGAGDAMVAGLCKAIYEEREDKMLEYGISMAASTIALEGTRMGRLE